MILVVQASPQDCSEGKCLSLNTKNGNDDLKKQQR